MHRPQRWGALLVVVASLFLAACTEAPSGEHVVNEPVRLEEIEGTDLERVILTQKAAERTGIETTPVKKNGKRLVVPSAAVFFDQNGLAWVYINPRPLVFERREIEIDFEEGKTAFLSDGPPPGTRVVTVGVPELYGAESEIGH
jgi:hypothetical protein